MSTISAWVFVQYMHAKVGKLHYNANTLNKNFIFNFTLLYMINSIIDIFCNQKWRVKHEHTAQLHQHAFRFNLPTTTSS